jgi:hypothetical protein
MPAHDLSTTPLSLCRSDHECDEQQVIVRLYFNVIPEQGFSLATFPSFGLSSQEPAAD